MFKSIKRTRKWQRVRAEKKWIKYGRHYYYKNTSSRSISISYIIICILYSGHVVSKNIIPRYNFIYLFLNKNVSVYSRLKIQVFVSKIIYDIIIIYYILVFLVMFFFSSCENILKLNKWREDKFKETIPNVPVWTFPYTYNRSHYRWIEKNK